MSHTHYAKLWLLTREDWEKVLVRDKSVQEGKPIEDKSIAAKIVLDMYIRYRNIVHRLTECHDNIVQPQIREIIGRMLDYSIIRMLEYRQEAVNLTFTECPYPTEFPLDLKLTLDDIDLRAPVYNAGLRLAEFERRSKVVQVHIAMLKRKEEEELAELKVSSSVETEGSTSRLGRRKERAKSEKKLSVGLELIETPEEKAAREAREAERKVLSDKMTLIQSHERARVARNLAKNAIRRRKLNEKLMSGQWSPKKVDEEELVRAAIVIQKTWKGIRARREIKRRKCQVEELLNMTLPSWRSRSADKLCEAEFRETILNQQDAVRKFEKTIASERKKIWKTRGPALVEEIKDEIREWFFLWFNQLGFFDSIPAAQDGGSILIATGQSRTPDEYTPEPPDTKKKSNKSSPEDLPKDDDEEEEDEDPDWQMPESKVFPQLMEINEEFFKYWNNRSEQILDPEAGLIMELIWDKLYHQLQLEMREIADEAMREELQELNTALIADFEADGVKFVPPKPEQFPSEQPSKPVKERIDPLAEVTEDELLIELTSLEVIRNDMPESNLNDWPGIESYHVVNASEIRLGDVKQPVMDYCVLPMASKIVHELSPLVRSVCLCGPPNCGQLFMAQAICTELKATVFDLTPEKHVGRFMGKASQDRLVQVVLKLAKAYAPTVVFVEGGEKPWRKKMPPELRRVKPKRFAKIYNKIVKGIKPGDQVLFLTTSSEPYMAGKPFVKLHDKFIIIPVADYATIYQLYKNSLMRLGAIERNFDVSSLAKITANKLPVELAKLAVDRATGIARRMLFNIQPLKQTEILEKIFETNMPTKKELEAFQKFRDKLPLEAKRRELEAENQEVDKNKKKK